MFTPADFADFSWLFACQTSNRKIIRQDFDEAALLWRAVRESQGDILEIGRRFGGSTVLLLAAGGTRSVTSIDLRPEHNPLCQAVFDAAVAGNPERLQLIVGNSREAIPGRKFGFMFVDGDHSYEGVKSDTLAHWESLVAPGNFAPLILYHDAVPNKRMTPSGGSSHCEGVRKLCNELIASGSATKRAEAGSSMLLQKVGPIHGS